MPNPKKTPQRRRPAYVPPAPPRVVRWTHPAETSFSFLAPAAFRTHAELLRAPENPPTVVVTPLAFFKIWTLVSSIGLEVGWLGTARQEGRTIFIDDVFLFKQTVSGGHTEIKSEALEEFVMEILSRPDGETLFNNMRFWGHSHVNGGTYPSWQDNDQMYTFEQFGADFFVRGIFNRFGQASFSVYDWEEGMAYHETPWRIEGDPLPDADELNELWKALRAEMRSKVTALSFASPITTFVKSFLEPLTGGTNDTNEPL